MRATQNNTFKKKLVSHFCAERLEAVCDLGRLPSDIESDFGHLLEFSHLPSPWWYTEDGMKWTHQTFPQNWNQIAEKRNIEIDYFVEPEEPFQHRVEKFWKFLKEDLREYQSFVVFSHHDFLQTFGGSWKIQPDGSKIFEGPSMKNCEIHTIYF
jgi:hypothetical protein